MKSILSAHHIFNWYLGLVWTVFTPAHNSIVLHFLVTKSRPAVHATSKFGSPPIYQCVPVIITARHRLNRSSPRANLSLFGSMATRENMRCLRLWPALWLRTSCFVSKGVYERTSVILLSRPISRSVARSQHLWLIADHPSTCLLLSISRVESSSRVTYIPNWLYLNLSWFDVSGSSLGMQKMSDYTLSTVMYSNNEP